MIAALLIEHGADVSQSTCNGWTPLYTAYENDYEKLTALLIEHGANGFTPLYIACQEGHEKVAALLI